MLPVFSRRTPLLRSFTLLELMAVVIVIGILASFALPQYAKIKQRSLDEEAKTTLSMIMAAERMYKIENSVFCAPPAACNSIDDINSSLSLSLDEIGVGNWDYRVSSTDTTSYQSCCVQAKSRDGSKYWSLKNSDIDFYPAGC